MTSQYAPFQFFPHFDFILFYYIQVQTHLCKCEKNVSTDVAKGSFSMIYFQKVSIET